MDVQTLTQTNWSKLVETTNQQNKSNQIILILHLDQSLLYMFANYQKRFSITSYGGNLFYDVSGFEQVVTNGIPTYYVVDASYYSRVIQFDNYWDYKQNNELPYDYSSNIKYVNRYFYFTADQYFYKTDANFNLIDYHIEYHDYYDYDYYYSFYYYSNSSLFYVSSSVFFQGISIFDTNCNFLDYMTLGGYIPYALSYFNGNLYGYNIDGSGQHYISIVVASKANGDFVAQYNTLCSNDIYSITIDSFGYMAVCSC